MTDDCREAFEKKFKTLDLTKTRDAWDRTIYAHSHIQAMFEGYEAAWSERTPPAGDAPKDISALIAEVTSEIDAVVGNIQQHTNDFCDSGFGDEMDGNCKDLERIAEKLTVALKDKGVSAPKIDFEGLKKTATAYGITQCNNDGIYRVEKLLHGFIDHIAAKYPHLRKV